MKNHQQGFTIVELLIVIVVIAILAAISIVAYSGIQTRANDTAIRSGVAQIEKALHTWVIDHPLPIRGGSGSTVAASGGECSNGVSGFFGSGTYTCAVEDALISAGALPAGFTAKLPKNTYAGGTGAHSVMLYMCPSSSSKYGLYWTLQSPTSDDTTKFDAARVDCGTSTSIRDSWGMRGGKVLQF